MEANQDNVNQIAAAASVAAAAAAVNSTAGIMKELSDIKVAQAKNDTEIKNIGASVQEIKSDVKDIKMLYVTHAELNSFIGATDKIDDDHERRVRRLELWGTLAIGGLWVIQLLIGWYLIIHFH
jgi:hypothetical protein